MPDKVVLKAAHRRRLSARAGVYRRRVLSGRVVSRSHGVWAREGRRLLRTIVSRRAERLEAHVQVARWILGSEPSTRRATFLPVSRPAASPVASRRIPFVVVVVVVVHKRATVLLYEAADAAVSRARERRARTQRALLRRRPPLSCPCTLLPARSYA